MTHKLKLTVTAAGALALAGAGIAAGATSGHGIGKKSPARAGAVRAGNGPGHPGGPLLGGPNRGGQSDDLDAAATYLGVTSAALLTDLQSGKTLAQVAGGSPTS